MSQATDSLRRGTSHPLASTPGLFISVSISLIRNFIPAFKVVAITAAEARWISSTMIEDRWNSYSRQTREKKEFPQNLEDVFAQRKRTRGHITESGIRIEVGILLKFATSASLCAIRLNPKASEGSEGEQTQTKPVCPPKTNKQKNNKTPEW